MRLTACWAWASRTRSTWSSRSCPSSDEQVSSPQPRPKTSKIWYELDFEIQFLYQSRKKVNVSNLIQYISPKAKTYMHYAHFQNLCCKLYEVHTSFVLTFPNPPSLFLLNQATLLRRTRLRWRWTTTLWCARRRKSFHVSSNSFENIQKRRCSSSPPAPASNTFRCFWREFWNRVERFLRFTGKKQNAGTFSNLSGNQKLVNKDVLKSLKWLIGKMFFT